MKKNTAYDNELSDSQPFFLWLKDNMILAIAQIGGLVTIATYVFNLLLGLLHDAKIIPEIKNSWLGNSDHMLRFALFGHIVVILVLISMLLLMLDKNSVGTYMAKILFQNIYNSVLTPSEEKSLFRKSHLIIKTFKQYFLYFWIALLLLYTVRLLDYSNFAQQDSVSANKPFDNFFSTFQHCQLQFYTYGLNVISGLFIFWCYNLMESPPNNAALKAEHNQFKTLSAFFASLFLIAYPAALYVGFKICHPFIQLELREHNLFFCALGGMFNVAAFFLLASRFASNIIGLQPLLKGVLYFYALLQSVVFTLSAFEVFNKDNPVSYILTGTILLILVLKISFFLIVTYVLQTGKALCYFVSVNTLHKRVDSVLKNDYVMGIDKKHGNEYSFEIRKEDMLVYSTDEKYQSREICRELLIDLRKTLDRRENYIINETEGTVWIEVMWENKLLCMSTDLKSRIDAEILITESIQMLPYCRLKNS